MSTKLQEHVPLAPWTTFGVGGPARYFLDARSVPEVIEALDVASTRKLPVFVLGGGSNLLVADSGYPGVVLRIGIRGQAWHSEGSRVLLDVAAGDDWDAVVGAAVSRGLSGIECLSGIPGLAGGTPVQNVGAYGQETSDVLRSVQVMERVTGKVVDLLHAQCSFEYRRSIFNTTEKDRYIVLRVRYALDSDTPALIQYPDLRRRFEGWSRPPTVAEVRQAVREIRSHKGMLITDGDPECRSAGSFFKNPLLTAEEFRRLQGVATETVPQYPAASGMVKTSAAWLIERSGFARGFVLGRAAVSSKHTLALVNRGGATADDILRLARRIRSGVEDHFGIRLLPEPVFVGVMEDF